MRGASESPTPSELRSSSHPWAISKAAHAGFGGRANFASRQGRNNIASDFSHSRLGAILAPRGPNSLAPGIARGRAWSLTLLTLLALILTGCGPDANAGGLEAAVTSTTTPPEARRVAVSVERLTSERVVDVARIPAELRPRRRATLAAEAAGVVEELTVDAGDRVRSGQGLMAVDTRSLEQRLAEAEAVDRQRQAEVERARKLFERRSITDQQRLEAETARELARVQLASAQLMLDKSRLVAPWTGTVAERHVEVGDFVAVGQPVLTLLDVERLDARAPAPASLAPHLEVGQRVEVRLDFLAGEVFEGTIRRLAAELDPATRTLDVDVELDNRQGRLRPGMTARIEVPRQTLEAAVVAPLDALVELEDRRIAYVVVDSSEGSKAERRELELGPVVGQRVVVLDGLAVGDLLIVEGHQQVGPGQAVELVDGDPSSGPLGPGSED